MQAPIGPAATPELVAAVCGAGGLGTLAAAWTPPAILRDQVREVARATDRPFCVNLVLDFEQAGRLDLLVEERVPAISFAWGVDEAAIRRARENGIVVLVQVGDRPSADRATAAGADVLIAQGVEAGGHVQSRVPLIELVRELAGGAAPVLAAGGIADAATAASARAAGAAGVVAGTAYLAAAEADVHPLYRDRVLASEAQDAVMTTLFDVGWPGASHRVLRNSTLDAWEAAGRPPSGARPGEGEPVAERFGRPIARYADALPTTDTTGDVEAMALYAGTGVGSVRTVETAADITRRLMA